MQFGNTSTDNNNKKALNEKRARLCARENKPFLMELLTKSAFFTQKLIIMFNIIIVIIFFAIFVVIYTFESINSARILRSTHSITTVANAAADSIELLSSI